jgi:hypothetical protein
MTLRRRKRTEGLDVDGRRTDTRRGRNVNALGSKTWSYMASWRPATRTLSSAGG